jgi:hypothetical protein
MIKEDYEKLNNKVVCGDNEGPILITGIDVVERFMASTNERKPVLQFSGTAKAYLNNPNNPGDGSEPLPEPLVVVFDMDVLEKDQTISLKNMNMALELEGKEAIVEDGEDWLERFAEDGENSVVDKLRNMGLYFTLRSKQDIDKELKYNNFPMWANIHVPPKRKPVTKDSLQAFRDKLKEKLAKAKENAEASKDVFGEDSGNPF